MKSLSIENLHLFTDEKSILSKFNFQLSPGMIHCLAGKSGSGKSTFAMTLFGLQNPDIKMEYSKYNILGFDFINISQSGWKFFRGKKICMIPQSPSSSFHPYIKIKTQIFEYMHSIGLKNILEIQKILESAGITDIDKKMDQYPSRLSGGEKQRILILLSMLAKPRILVADEPTTALDPVNEKKCLELIYSSVKKNNTSLILISHDQRVVNAMADQVTNI